MAPVHVVIRSARRAALQQVVELRQRRKARRGRRKAGAGQVVEDPFEALQAYGRDGVEQHTDLRGGRSPGARCAARRRGAAGRRVRPCPPVQGRPAFRAFPGDATPVGARGVAGHGTGGRVDAMTAPVPPRAGVRRSRSGAVLGGVCAGIARSAGLDPLLLRIALVAVTVLTGGAGLVAYLAAWVLIPREAEAPGAPVDGGAPAVGARDRAWSAAGKDLRSLADEFRKPQSGSAAHPTAAAHRAAPPDRWCDDLRRRAGRPDRRRADGGHPRPIGCSAVRRHRRSRHGRREHRGARRCRAAPALTARDRRRRRDGARRPPARPRGPGRGPAGGRQRVAGPRRERRRGRQAGPARPHLTRGCVRCGRADYRSWDLS